MEQTRQRILRTFPSHPAQVLRTVVALIVPCLPPCLAAQAIRLVAFLWQQTEDCPSVRSRGSNVHGSGPARRSCIPGVLQPPVSQLIVHRSLTRLPAGSLCSCPPTSSWSVHYALIWASLMIAHTCFRISLTEVSALFSGFRHWIVVGWLSGNAAKHTLGADSAADSECKFSSSPAATERWWP